MLLISHHNTMNQKWWKSAPSTVVMEMPQDLDLIINGFLKSSGDAKAMFNVGIAKLHPKDRFVRKTGVSIAKQKLKEQPLIINGIYINSSLIKIELVDETTQVEILLIFDKVNSKLRMYNRGS